MESLLRRENAPLQVAGDASAPEPPARRGRTPKATDAEQNFCWQPLEPAVYGLGYCGLTGRGIKFESRSQSDLYSLY